MPQFSRWQAVVLGFCAVLVVGGVLGLLSVRGGDAAEIEEKRTLEEYDSEAVGAPEDVVISAENAQVIAIEALPEKGAPTETVFEGDIWEVVFSDGTEVKIDVGSGEIVEIEY